MHGRNDRACGAFCDVARGTIHRAMPPTMTEYPSPSPQEQALAQRRAEAERIRGPDLLPKHTEGCRVLPNRATLLDAIPKLAVEKVLRDFFQAEKNPVFTGTALPGSHPCDPAGYLSTACRGGVVAEVGVAAGNSATRSCGGCSRHGSTSWTHGS